MTRLLSLLLLLGQLPALAAESPAPAAPVFDKQGRTLGAPLAERVTDYEIDARLDPTTHALTGQETLHRVDRWLAESDANPAAKRYVREARADIARALKAQAADARA